MNQNYLIIFFCISICSTAIAVYMWIRADIRTTFYKSALNISQANEKELRRLLAIEESLSAPAEAQQKIVDLERALTTTKGELQMGLSIIEQQRGSINNLKTLLNRCNSRWANEKHGKR